MDLRLHFGWRCVPRSATWDVTQQVLSRRQIVVARVGAYLTFAELSERLSLDALRIDAGRIDCQQIIRKLRGPLEISRRYRVTRGRQYACRASPKRDDPPGP